MPITIVCPECKKQYRAPDAMAGRKVRCKGCHNIFDVAKAGDSHASSSGSVMDLNAHAQSEYGQTAYTGGGDDEGDIGLRAPGATAAVPSDPNAVFESAFQSFVPDRRENVPFKFPWSRQLDMIVPWLLVLVALAVALPRAISVTASAPGWVPVVRVVVLLVTFLLIVYPLTRAAVKRASRVLRFELPPKSKWRTVASFALPFALVYAFWAVSADLHVGFVAGSIMAVLLAGASVYFLFRLQPREAGGTLATTVGAFVVSLLLTAGVMVGVNRLALEVAKSSGGRGGDPVALNVSPIAEGLKWELPPPTPKPVATQTPGGHFITQPDPEPPPPQTVDVPPAPVPQPPASVGDPRTRPSEVVQGIPTDPGASKLFPPGGTTRPGTPGVAVVRTPGHGTNPDTTTPPPPPPTAPEVAAPPPPAPGADLVADKVLKAKSPLVAGLRDTTALGTFERLVAPTTTSPWVLAVKGNTVQAWNMQTWKPGASGELPPAGDDPRVAPTVVPTPDGRSVVRAVSFPQLSLRVEPINSANGPPPQSAVIKEAPGRASVEGMLDAERVLVRWESGGQQGLEVWNMKTGGRGKGFDLPPFEHGPSNGRLSPDGRWYALVAQATPPPQRNAPPGAAVGPRPHLHIWDVNRGGQQPAMLQPINAVDPRWATQPTGMAFSADMKYVAVLFEHGGTGIVVIWKFPLAARLQPVATPLPAGQLPASPHNGVNRLTSAEAGWLVAGNLLMAADGAILGNLGLTAGAGENGAATVPPIVSQHVHGDTVLLTHGSAKELRATAVKLNATKPRPAGPQK